MPIVAKDTGSVQPAPVGMHNAVCVDVVDLGVKETQWGPKEKIQIIWEIEDIHPDFGDPFRVSSHYTLTLSEKGRLRADLESWRGRPFTEEELRGFDLEKLIGAPCMINVVHNTAGGKTYANPKAITPLPKGMDRLEISETYERVKDRVGGYDVRSPQEGGGDGQGAYAESDFADDADLPF